MNVGDMLGIFSPPLRLGIFWAMIAKCLGPHDGWVFFGLFREIGCAGMGGETKEKNTRQVEKENNIWLGQDVLDREDSEG